MIYVTGDTHGTLDWKKLQPASWPEGQELTRDDYVIICGDFGGIWNGDERDSRILQWYEDQPWTTLWLDGNHENFDLIEKLPVKEMFGGRVQVAPGFSHVIHLMRGEVYDLPCGDGNNVRCFVMGGAPSMDRQWRIEGLSWWPQEMPSQDDYDHATASLEKVGWSVDYVFTHEVPYSMMTDVLDWDYWTKRRNPPTNELSGFLQWVDDQLDHDRLKMWYIGHYHVDRVLRDEHHCVLYRSVVRLGEGPQAE